MAKNPRFEEHRQYLAMTLELGREPTDQEWDEFQDYWKHRQQFLAWQARHTSDGSAESQR
jgi:hypothetical protein